MKRVSSVLEALFFICLGGMLYYFMELISRGHSHYSMMLCGGLAFYAGSLINHYLEGKLFLISRMILSAMVITLIEFCFGVYFNLYLHQHVWDYSAHLIQYKGQICLTFSVIWFFLSWAVFGVEKWVRRELFS